MAEAMEEALTSIPLPTWLDVLPQLIARIDAPSGRVRGWVRRLLIVVGQTHPQALIYPITLAATTGMREGRREGGREVLRALRREGRWEGLVEEGGMVARELIHVAMTRQELWHEGLEEASRLYFGGGEGGGGGASDVRAAEIVRERWNDQ